MATFTIRLYQDAIWTNQGTWTFAIEGGVSVTGTINTSSPTTDKLLEFDVPLVTAVGDVVTVEYAPGNLRKASSDPGEDLMEPFGLSRLLLLRKLERKGIWEISETARKAENRARKP